MPNARFLISPDAIDRVAQLGSWSERARSHAHDHLADRIPGDGGKAAGFDAGIACCLDLIPRRSQRLAAMLHGGYTKEAVDQVRHEAGTMDPDSETAYWLAASSLCLENVQVDEIAFADQVRRFEALVRDPVARRAAAQAEYAEMCRGFELRDHIPYALRDGGMQGAYVAGHRLAVQWADRWGIFFVGTYLPSLGLEGFAFADGVDGSGRKTSGLLSNNLAKCTKEEVGAVLAAVRTHLGI